MRRELENGEAKRRGKRWVPPKTESVKNPVKKELLANKN
jgi:hypothetical protein